MLLCKAATNSYFHCLLICQLFSLVCSIKWQKTVTNVHHKLPERKFVIFKMFVSSFKQYKSINWFVDWHKIIYFDNELIVIFPTKMRQSQFLKCENILGLHNELNISDIWYRHPGFLGYCNGDFFFHHFLMTIQSINWTERLIGWLQP